METSYLFETIPVFIGIDFTGFETCFTEFSTSVTVLACGTRSTSVRITTLNLEGEAIN